MKKVQQTYPHDLRIRRTRSAITHALARLLRDKQLCKVTITEICRVACINRKTFYLHFSSVEEAFEYMLHHIRDGYTEIQRCFNSPAGYDLSGAVHAMLHAVEQDLEFFRNLAYSTEYSRILLFILDFSTKIRMEFINPNESQFHTVKLTQFFLNSGFIFTLIDWLQEGGDTSLEELNRFFEDIFLHTRNLYRMDTVLSSAGQNRQGPH